MDLPPKPEPDRCGGRGSLEDVGALVASRSHRTEPVEVVDRQLNFVAGPVDFRIEAGRATALTAPDCVGRSAGSSIWRQGTTAACAAATRRPRRTSSAGRDHPRVAGDHPRVRGDHTAPVHCLIMSQGPPPRARGPLHPLLERSGPPGTTRPAARRPASRWDHPRVRGDHTLLSPASRIDLGPPPRARGPPFVNWGFRWWEGCFCCVVEKPAYLAFLHKEIMRVVRLVPFCPPPAWSGRLRRKRYGSVFRRRGPGVR